MSALRDDEWYLKSMQRELERYVRGKQILPGLADALEVGTEALTDCRPELIERMVEEWRLIEGISEIALAGSHLVPLPGHHRVLEESLRTLERLIELALSEVGTA